MHLSVDAVEEDMGFARSLDRSPGRGSDRGFCTYVDYLSVDTVEEDETARAGDAPPFLGQRGLVVHRHRHDLRG